MPELPEVETIARGLAPGLVGRTILAMETPFPGVLRPGGTVTKEGVGARPLQDPEKVRALLTGKRVAAVRRRAKLLIVDLQHPANGAPAAHLLFHLKMSGRVYLAAPELELDRHCHLRLALDDGARLVFRDPRKFGWAAAFSPEELAAWPDFAAIGPEPLEVAKADFVAALQSRNARIKALLLNQSVLAGVGNIYADESLYRAGIGPEERGADISAKRLGRLWTELRAALTEAIASGGSTIRDYRTASGEVGLFQHAFRAYGKGGQPCERCGGVFETGVVAGRTTTFCAGCQKPPPPMGKAP